MEYRVKFEGSDDIVKFSRQAKEPAPKRGETVEGSIEDGQWGKSFREDRKRTGSKPARDDSAIQAQFAINQAREWVQYAGETDRDRILEEAKHFFLMIQEVKEAKPGVQPIVKPAAKPEPLPAQDIVYDPDTVDLNDIKF
jgi:hypothetical protein